MSGPQLGDLLTRWRGDLVRFAERHGGEVLRHESAEDLVQGVHLRALAAADTFTWQGEKPFLAWMHALARAHISDRREHWAAAKRDAGRLLRLTDDPARTSDPRAVASPPEVRRGPATAASHADEVRLALQALSLLSPRDRELVGWESEGVAIDDQAARLGVTYEAAQRARLRAIERFRKTFAVLARAGDPRPS
jgi:RNA polymerase sigma factor (sigma-70 family)